MKNQDSDILMNFPPAIIVVRLPQDDISSGVFMQSAPGIIIAHIPNTEAQKVLKAGISSRPCVSNFEDIASTSTNVYGSKKEKKMVNIKESAETLCSNASTLVPRNLFNREIEDLGKEIELPYPTTVQGKHIGLSRSCVTFSNYDENFCGSSMYRSISFYERRNSAEEKTQPIDFEALRAYNEARKMYELYKMLSNTEPEFLETENHCQECYPYYWRHLCTKCNIYPNSQNIQDTQDFHEEIIETLKDILDEEEEMNGRRTETAPELKGETLAENFGICISYMKKKHPFLFTYLMKRYDFESIVEERLTVRNNRRELVKLLDRTKDELNERERRYSSQKG